MAMNIAPISVMTPIRMNMPCGPMPECTMYSIEIAFSSRLMNMARMHRPKAVSTATSAAYIHAIGPYENWKLKINTHKQMMIGILMSKI